MAARRRPSAPARNAARWLPQQLAALAAQDVPGPWEVVWADNGSCDATRQLAASWRDRLPLRVVDLVHPSLSARDR